MKSMLTKIAEGDSYINIQDEDIVLDKSTLSTRIYRKCNFKNQDLENIMYTGLIFSHCHFEQINFTNSVLMLCSFNESTFENCKFHDVNFFNAGFNSSHMIDVAFTECILNNSRFIGVEPKNLSFDDCNIHQCIFLEKMRNNKDVKFKLCNNEEAYFVQRKYY